MGTAATGDPSLDRNLRLSPRNHCTMYLSGLESESESVPESESANVNKPLHTYRNLEFHASVNIPLTRMHSSRMRTARSLTVSRRYPMHAPRQPRTPSPAPQQPWTPPENHACPPQQPCTPPRQPRTSPPPWTEWQTGVKILPCPKLRLRAVITKRLVLINWLQKLGNPFNRVDAKKCACVRWGTYPFVRTVDRPNLPSPIPPSLRTQTTMENTYIVPTFPEWQNSLTFPVFLFHFS